MSKFDLDVRVENVGQGGITPQGSNHHCGGGSRHNCGSRHCGGGHYTKWCGSYYCGGGSYYCGQGGSVVLCGTHSCITC